MTLPPQTTSLIAALEQLGPHDHLCSIYENPEEHYAVAIPFIRIGLERGEKCIYIADDGTTDDVRQSMRSNGIDVDRAISSNALVLITKEQAYLEHGSFHPDWMSTFWKEATQLAIQEGFSALRATGETEWVQKWVLSECSGLERWMEYESRLTHTVAENNCSALCQYNRRLFPPELILDVIRTHPVVVNGGKVCRNLYFVPPDDFLATNQAAREVERLLTNIRERERVEDALREQFTERKQAEEALRMAQAELAHVTRVTTAGELVATIAHEVNQPLGAIVTNGHACVRLLSREAPDLEKSRELIEHMIGDGMRASEVIKRIRGLLHKTPTEREPLNINETIQQVIALVDSDVLSSRIKLKADLAGDLPTVVGDRVQLQQVVLNLILNGRDAISATKTGRRELLITSRNSESGEVVVAVCDSGAGLDPKNVERIFEPFFTTKAEGMGLGLSIGRTIVEAHGGTLWATPNRERGTTILFTLPPSTGASHEESRAASIRDR
jgi:signal transduction histidine kinase